MRTGPKSLTRRLTKVLSTTKSEKNHNPQIAITAVWGLDISYTHQYLSVKDGNIVITIEKSLKNDCFFMKEKFFRRDFMDKILALLMRSRKTPFEIGCRRHASRWSGV